MQQITRYKCEICGYESAHEEAAKYCETSHATHKNLIAIGFKGYENGSALPEMVCLSSNLVDQHGYTHAIYKKVRSGDEATIQRDFSCIPLGKGEAT